MWSAGESVRRYRVRLDLADADLADALADALEASPSLAAAEPGERAHVTVTDSAAPAADPPVLRLAGGPLPPDAPADLILSAAHLLAAGLRLEPDSPRPAAPHLSPREREVLAHIADGASNKAIARTLGITERTAKFHVAAVLSRLHARNRSEAVSIAIREGLLVL